MKYKMIWLLKVNCVVNSIDQKSITNAQYNSPNKYQHQQKIQRNKHNIDVQIQIRQISKNIDYLENTDKLQKQYFEFFKNFISNAEKYIPEMPSDEEFKRHKIKYLHGSQFHKKLQSYQQPYIRVKNTERQGTIINYTVIISIFELEITLLNVKQKANTQKNKIGSGSFGSVRIQSQNKRMFAVKRIMFQDEYHLKEFKMMANKYEINEVIKQLAIYKICSLLKIGPAAETDIGFDLICYKDCIQFQIEFCLKIQKWLQNEIYVQKSKFEKQMKQCLLILHFFRIIHKDIKVENILFSVKYNKYVLTDFGISHPVIEKIGYLSKTPREGTFQYMSDQMIKIEPNSTGYIHLYGNDVHSLSVVLKKQLTNQNLQQRIKLFKQYKQYQNLKYEYEYLKLKYYCIKPDSKMEQVQSYWRIMNNNRLNQLIGTVDKSIEYNKIKSVYNYLSKFQEFKNINLDNLRIQSQSIKSVKIELDIKQNTYLQLKNTLRVYGYSIQVKKIITKLNSQQKYKETLKIIHRVLDNEKDNLRDRMFGDYRNYIKKIKKQLQKLQEQQNNQQIFKRYMIILQHGNRTEQLETMEKLKKIQYKRSIVEEKEQMIRKMNLEKKKDQIQKFIQWMDNKNKKNEIEKILIEKGLYGHVAEIFRQIGKYETALTYYTKSLNMDISFHGQQHPNIARIYNNIALIYNSMGKYETALIYYTKSLNMDISYHGQQHPTIAAAYNNIASVYNKMGKYEATLTYYTKNLKILLSFYGQQHPNIATTYNNIAGVYYNMGKYETALTYYTNSLNIDLLYHEQRYMNIATRYNNIANVFNNMGKYDIALTYLTNGLNMYILIHGQQHPNIAAIFNNMAGVYDRMGQYETALTYFIKSLDILIIFHEQQHPTIAITYNNIASVYNKMGKYEIALTYLTKSLNIDISFHGQQHPNIAKRYNNIANNYLSLGNLLSAQKYIRKSFFISFNLIMDTNFPLIAANYYLLSYILFNQNKIIKSLRYSDLALDTFLKFNPLDHPQSPNYILLIAKIYYQMNRFIQSYFFYRLSCQILVRYFPLHHTNVRNAKHMMNEMEWSMPQSIHNYTSNIELINNINSKYSQLPKHKLIKVLFAKKQQLRFEQQHRSRRDNVEYLKCEIEIYLCYKYLGYLREQKKLGELIQKELQRFQQSEQKAMFIEFIKEISLE